MQTFTDKEIRARFSPFDGWECQRAPSPATRDTIFLLTRDVRGKKETVALAVSFDEEPSVTALAGIAAGHTGRHALKGQYLLVPKDCKRIVSSRAYPDSPHERVRIQRWRTHLAYEKEGRETLRTDRNAGKSGSCRYCLRAARGVRVNLPLSILFFRYFPRDFQNSWTLPDPVFYG